MESRNVLLKVDKSGWERVLEMLNSDDAIDSVMIDQDEIAFEVTEDRKLLSKVLSEMFRSSDVKERMELESEASGWMKAKEEEIREWMCEDLVEAGKIVRRHEGWGAGRQLRKAVELIEGCARMEITDPPLDAPHVAVICESGKADQVAAELIGSSGVVEAKVW